MFLNVSKSETRVRPGGIVICLCIVHFCLLAFSSWNKSPTYDEPNHLRYGKQIIESFDFTRFDNSKMPVSALNAVSEKIHANIFSDRNSRRLLLAGRLPNMLFGTAILPAVYLIARMFFGSGAAVVAAVAAALDPNIIAHSRLITTDIPVTTFVIWAAFFWVRYSRDHSPKHLVPAAVLSGFGLISKYSALVFAVYVILAFPVWLIRRLRADLSRTVSAAGVFCSCFPAHALLWIGIVVVTIWAGYGFRGIGDTIDTVRWKTDSMQAFSSAFPGFICPLPPAYLEGLDWCVYDDRRPVDVYCCQEKTTEPVKRYFFVAFVIKTPVGFLILWMAALAVLAVNRRITGSIRAFMLPGFWYFIVIAFTLRSQLGIRYMLPFFPFMHVLAACVFHPENPSWLRKTGWVMLAWVVVSVLMFYPHFIPYCNELTGGRINLYRYLSDSNVDWGQDQWLVDAAVRKYHGYPLSRFAELPTPGIVTIPVGDLTGITAPWERYRWLRENYRPVDSIGYSCLVFQVPFEDMLRFHNPISIMRIPGDTEIGFPGLTETMYRLSPDKASFCERIVREPFPDVASDYANVRSPFRIVREGFMRISRPGVYLLGVESDDGSQIWLNRRLVVDNSGSHTVSFIGRVFMFDEGYYACRICYDDYGGDRFFKFYARCLDQTQFDDEIRFFQAVEPAARDRES